MPLRSLFSRRRNRGSYSLEKGKRSVEEKMDKKIEEERIAQRDRTLGRYTLGKRYTAKRTNKVSGGKRRKGRKGRKTLKQRKY